MAIDTIDEPQSPNDRKMAGLPYASRVEQIPCQGEEVLESLESFDKNSIDWSRLLDHLSIHMDGETAGSQFDSAVFKSPQEVVDLIMAALPDTIPLDQHRSALITIDIAKEHGPMMVGWAGVKAVSEIRSIYPEAEIKKEIRMPGGVEDNVDGLEGAWYPERKYNPETKSADIVLGDDGQPVNPRAKFEPKANIVRVAEDKFREVAATSKIALVIVKNREEDKPVAVTAYPGENAPAFPARIQTKSGYKKDTLSPDSYETRYWQDHVFIKTE